MRDDGQGMERKDVKHAHKLFGYQRMSQVQTASGIGVGLSVCKFITEKYGGVVKVNSRPRHGSLFQSSFLLQQQDENECLNSL